MEDNIFWIQFWRVAFLFLAISVMSLSGCEIKSRMMLAESDKPMELDCSFGISTYNQSVCTIIAQHITQEEKR